jgi:hypothetical protein
MGIMSMRTDVREFKNSMAIYAAGTRKSMPEVINRAGLNLSLRTAQYLPKAERQRIDFLEAVPWWPKFIAKMIRSEGGVSWQTGRKTKRTVRFQGAYTVADARKVSKRLLGSRRRSISFMKSGFVRASRAFGGTGGSERSNLTKVDARVTVASIVRPAADIIVRYEANRRKPQDAAQKSRIAMKAVMEAMRFVSADMKAYGEKKLAEQARAVSAR